MFVLFLATWSVIPASAQDVNPSSGVVDDWTHHRVIFSDPGTLLDAVMNGRRDEWQSIVNDPRYRLQQIKRGAAFAARMGDFGDPDAERARDHDEGGSRGDRSLKGDWSVTVAASGASVAIDMYPAKYTFSTTAAPSCTADYVIYPINTAGNSSQQANLIGVTNLYKGTCSGNVPTVLFAYYVGTGAVQTSPVLSLDGTKVAFVESRTTGASIFHVLKLDTSGNAGCPNASPCNGTEFNGPPAVPGTHNSAVDTKISLSGTGNIGVTRSSPFVDYSHDVAYVGDDTGRLHKFTGVFNGTPVEAGSPWPFTVAASVILTGPTYDSVSGNIFVGGSNGDLYCVTSAGAFCTTHSISVGTEAILDAPIVDSTRHTVFTEANNASNAILSQSTTALGSQVKVTMGKDGNNLYDGAFDNLYYTSVGTGHMYFCGNATTGSQAVPTLWRVGFNSSGVMNSSNDGTSFTLTSNGQPANCAPLTEIYNTSTTPANDYLFLGLSANGFLSGTHNCSGTACVVSFILPASGSSVPTSAHATMTNNVGATGPSGIIIDNVSGESGASQIYFGAPQINLGVQASQSGLE